MFFILSVFSGTETKHRISEKTVEQGKEIRLSETKKKDSVRVNQNKK